MTRVHFSDVELPRASIQRIIKDATDGQFVQKDAKLAFGKATTIFVSYLTAVAMENAKSSGHKTLNTQHIWSALEIMGYGDWRQELEVELRQYSSGGGSSSKKSPKKSIVDVEEDIEMMDDASEPVNFHPDTDDMHLSAQDNVDTIDDTQPMALD